MTAAARRIASCLLFAYAFLWPWGVYQYVPGLGQSATAVVGVALLLLLILDLAATRELRIPFELLWPVALSALACLFSPSQARLFIDRGPLALIVLYVATVHFSRSRTRIVQGLILSMAAAAGVAACSIAAMSGMLFPTAYSLCSTALAAGPRDLTSAAFAMAVGFAVAVYLALRPPDSLRRSACRLFGVCCAAVSAIALLLLTLRGLDAGVVAAWQPPQFNALRRTDLAALLLLLWLVARTAAKHVVAVNALRRDNPVLSAEAAMQGFLAALTIGATLFCLCFPVKLTASHGFLLGLAGAYALPDKERAKPLPVRTYLLLLPCVALAGINLVQVFLGNRSDPRNYDIPARSECDARQFAAVEQRMAAIERFAPNERRTHYWRARAELGYGFRHRAAREFAVAL